MNEPLDCKEFVKVLRKVVVTGDCLTFASIIRNNTHVSQHPRTCEVSDISEFLQDIEDMANLGEGVSKECYIMHNGSKIMKISGDSERNYVAVDEFPNHFSITAQDYFTARHRLMFSRIFTFEKGKREGWLHWYMPEILITW